MPTVEEVLKVKAGHTLRAIPIAVSPRMTIFSEEHRAASFTLVVLTLIFQKCYQ